MYRVRNVFSAWRPFVECWDELTDLYLEEEASGRAPRLYGRLKGLREVAMEADGWERTSPTSWKMQDA